MPQPIIFAVPKGRILEEALPLLEQAGIVPEAAFGDAKSRALKFSTNREDVDLIRVRAFDVATFVAHGAAQIGIVGSDVIDEFDYSELYAPVDLTSAIAAFRWRNLRIWPPRMIPAPGAMCALRPNIPI